MHGLLHIDSCLSEPLEVFFPQLGVNEMESLIPSCKAIFEERAKHSVFLFGAVEERTDMTLPTEVASGEMYRMVVRCHISTSIQSVKAGLQAEVKRCSEEAR
jgi:hypothetical protein